MTDSTPFWENAKFSGAETWLTTRDAGSVTLPDEVAPLRQADRRSLSCDSVRLTREVLDIVRTASTMTFSLPPELAKQIRDVAAEEGRSRSELIREALLRYVEGSVWRQVLSYGEARARERGLGPADVGRLVEEYRAEAPSTRA